MGTNCDPFAADSLYYEKGFILSPFDNNQADVIKAYNSTTKYLDDLLNINNPYIELMIGQVQPTEHQLNKAVRSMRRLSLMDISAIWLLSLVCLLMVRIIASS